jgi:hypothetical protein
MQEKRFFWLYKDYKNRSLNELAKSLAEYNTAQLFLKGYDVYFSKEELKDVWQAEIGDLFLDGKMSVNDLYLINDIINLNVYFSKNNEDRISISDDLKGTFDCLVSLAAGSRIETNPVDINLQGNHYIIDVSPTALHKSFGLYKDVTSYTQLDIFNTESVKNFISTCEGTKGLFTVSNCFLYMANSLVYDVKARLDAQNKFIEVLANDKIEWYVEIVTADGLFYNCVPAKDILNKELDKRFEVLPWI